MEKDTLNYTSAQTGVTYRLVMSRRSYTDYAEFGNPETAYQKYFTHTDIYIGDKWVFFWNSDNVPEAIDQYENPAPEHMHSRFD